MRFGNTIGLLAGVAPLALILAACSDDPTSEGAGNAYAIKTDRSITTQAAGNRFTIVAQLLDRLSTPLPTQLDASAGSDAIAIDSVKYLSELQETRIFVRAVSVSEGADIVITGGGITDTVTVRVPDGPFPGTAAVVTEAGRTLLRVTAQSNLFDANASFRVAGADSAGYIISTTPTELTYMLPFSRPAGTINYTVTGAGPSDFNLSGTVNNPSATVAADANEPNGNRAGATAFDITSPLYGSISLTNDEFDYLRFTVNEPGTYRCELSWRDSSDLDMFLLSETATVSNAGATASRPEAITANIATAGNYYVVVNAYDNAGGPVSTYRVTCARQ